MYIDAVVEKEVEVIVEKTIEVPVEKIVEVPIEIMVEKPVYKEVIIEEEVIVETDMDLVETMREAT